jgi:hypothetical protein
MELYRGGLEIIADAVRRAEDPDYPATDREGAWITIKSVLREVEKHKPRRQEGRMLGPILVVDSSDIREGKLEEVKAGVTDLVAFVEANEAEPLAYDRYFDETGSQMTVVQIHPDSASLERHLTVAAPVFRRFAELLTMGRVDVYGNTSDAALEQMRGKAQLLGNAPVVVHAFHSGFCRFVASG